MRINIHTYTYIWIAYVCVYIHTNIHYPKYTPYHTALYHTIPCHTMPYHAMPDHTIARQTYIYICIYIYIYIYSIHIHAHSGT